MHVWQTLMSRVPGPTLILMNPFHECVNTIPWGFWPTDQRIYMPIKVIRWTSKPKLYLNWTKNWSKVNFREQESMLHIWFTSYGNFAVSVAVLNREGSATNKSALSSLSLQTFGLLQWSLDLTLSDFTGVLEYWRLHWSTGVRCRARGIMLGGYISKLRPWSLASGWRDPPSHMF